MLRIHFYRRKPLQHFHNTRINARYRSFSKYIPPPQNSKTRGDWDTILRRISTGKVVPHTYPSHSYLRLQYLTILQLSYVLNNSVVKPSY